MCFTLNTKWIINEHSGYKYKSMICFRWIKGNRKWVLFCNRSKPREVLDVIGGVCVNLLWLLLSYMLTQTLLSQKHGSVLQTPVTRCHCPQRADGNWGMKPASQLFQDWEGHSIARTQLQVYAEQHRLEESPCNFITKPQLLLWEQQWDTATAHTMQIKSLIKRPFKNCK